MKSILVIEDEVQTRNIFLKCLEFEGFQALGASNGTQGIDLAKSDRPDLVVCDIMMPDMDGYSVLAALRRSLDTASIPLIFLTAKVTMADLRRGMELGADDYLTKPCTVEQFLAAITTRLQRRAEIARSHSSPSFTASERENQDRIFPDCPTLTSMFDFIEANFQKNISLKEIAQVVGYSPAYLTSLVQEQTGYTVKRWLIERRMAQARTLLKQSTDSIRKVAEASGYSDAGYFTRQFRKIHGVTPQVWREDRTSNASPNCDSAEWV